MKPSGFFAAFFAVFAILSLTGGTAAAEGKALGPAAQFVQRLGETALMSLTEKNMQRPVRERRVREILQNNFDIQQIGKFAMGAYWKDASESQRLEYMDLFEDMIVQTYTTRFEEYSGQTLKVSGSTPSGNDFIVYSQVVQKDGPPVSLEWRVRSKGGALRVVDVVVESVSMSVTQRSDFSAVIQRGGGKIESLLSSLRARKKSSDPEKI